MDAKVYLKYESDPYNIFILLFDPFCFIYGLLKDDLTT